VDHRCPRTRRLWLRTGRAVALAVAVALAGTLVSTNAVASTRQQRPAAAEALGETAFPAELSAYYTQSLAWAPCSDDLSCAWLTVPLDYAQPNGPTIRIRVSRVTATGPAEARQGSLVVNPGGPGASGLDLAAYVAQAIAPNVARQFDIVGFDTRGVGLSAPITCMTGAQTTAWLRADASPDTAAEQARLMSLARDLADGCVSRSPALASNVGTANTIRDLDILREVLGDTRLNWLGYSYWTYVGSLYAEQFPENVGRFVLDGAVDPSLESMEVARGQSVGFQTAMRRFAHYCATGKGCPFAGSVNDVLRGINLLLARLDRAPLPAHAGRDLVQSEALGAMFYAMYSPAMWPSLRLALRQATRGDGTDLQSMSDFANERTGTNAYATNMASAFPAISCWDMPVAVGKAGLRTAAKVWSRGVAVPDMARAMAWGNASCSQWFGHATRGAVPISSTTTAPILVVGTTFDPATPYAWAQSLSRQLPSSTLLTFRGDGHTAYGGNSRCIDDAVDTYLLTGVVPAPGTVCTPR
jgi:pimeloyl-ACP methyl ester carboxylesterase